MNCTITFKTCQESNPTNLAGAHSCRAGAHSCCSAAVCTLRGRRSLLARPVLPPASLRVPQPRVLTTQPLGGAPFFFLEMNDSANSSQSHGLPKHFSMFRVLCLRISYKHFPDLIEVSGKSCCVFFLAKIEGRYQEVLAYHIYLVSFENTESWDSWLNIVFSKLWDNLWTLQDYYIKCTFRLSVKKKHKKPVFSH